VTKNHRSNKTQNRNNEIAGEGDEWADAKRGDEFG
jgi:hypothetical protein